MNFLNTLQSFALPWPLEAEDGRWLHLGAEILVLTLTFAVLRPQALRLSRLEERDYARRFPILLLFKKPLSLLLFGLLAAPPFLHWNALAWGPLAGDWTLRFFVVVTSATVAWAFSLYEYNAFYGRLHLLERAFVLIGLGLLIVHPAFITPLTLVVLIQVHQFDYPLWGQYRWTDKIPILEVMILFSVFLFLSALGIPLSAWSFAIVAFSIPAASYFYSGVEKVRLGWFEVNRLSYLFLAAHDNGWLHFLNPRQLSRLARSLDRLNLPFKALTLLLELGVIFALAHPLLAAAFLVGLAGMHVGIFLASGICFWKWGVMDLALIPLLVLGWSDLTGTLVFAPLAFSAGLILIGPLICTAKFLGWYDTPLSGVYRFEGRTPDGAWKEIPPSRFAPYDFPFAQGRFHYLNPASTLVDVYGKAKTRELFEAIAVCRSTEEIQEVRRRLGIPRHKKRDIPHFERFIVAFFGNYLRFPRARGLLSRLAPPQHKWTHAVTPEAWDGRTPLCQLRVRYVETLFLDGEATVVSDRELRALDIGV